MSDGSHSIWIVWCIEMNLNGFLVLPTHTKALERTNTEMTIVAVLFRDLSHVHQTVYIYVHVHTHKSVESHLSFSWSYVFFFFFSQILFFFLYSLKIFFQIFISTQKNGFFLQLCLSLSFFFSLFFVSTRCTLGSFLYTKRNVLRHDTTSFDEFNTHFYRKTLLFVCLCASEEHWLQDKCIVRTIQLSLYI